MFKSQKELYIIYNYINRTKYIKVRVNQSKTQTHVSFQTNTKTINKVLKFNTKRQMNIKTSHKFLKIMAGELSFLQCNNQQDLPCLYLPLLFLHLLGKLLGKLQDMPPPENRPISRPCNNSSKLLGSRPRVGIRVLAMLVQCIVVEVVIQLHLAPIIRYLLIIQMTHVSVHLELHPLQVC